MSERLIPCPHTDSLPKAGERVGHTEVLAGEKDG